MSFMGVSGGLLKRRSMGFLRVWKGFPVGFQGSITWFQRVFKTLHGVSEGLMNNLIKATLVDPMIVLTL